MILTLSELLKEFVKANVEILNAQDVKHPTSIGDMYEGLSKEVMNRSLFGGLKLKIVKNSFIAGCKKEFDVMLVDGEGERLPFTDRFTFRPEQVIVIISVKKNLFASDLEDAFLNLQFIVDHYNHVKPEEYMARLFDVGFKGICRKSASAMKNRELTVEEEAIWDTLRTEAILPVRIVWGFNGYKSEKGLRESLNEFLMNNLTTDLNNKVAGFGPHNFPSLIICDKFSLIKQNGMPFAYPINQDKWWFFYTSSNYNPIYYLLEFIWTRLSFRYKELPNNIFGEDLQIETVARFLDCRIKKMDENYGWEYYHRRASEETLSEFSEQGQWEPIYIDDKQYVIITELCKKAEIDLNNHDGLDGFVMEGGTYSSLENFIQKLKETGLVHVEKNKLKLLTDECQCVILPNGKFAAGENKSGRLTRWLLNEIKKDKENNSEK